MRCLILPDEGTTASQSLATLVKVQSHYPKLKVIQTQNQGVAAARNQMVAITSGAYPA